MIRVVHVQKVSGISGSERHLLSTLPRLRGRGWDARMIVLHQGEPGARAFLDALDAPAVDIRMRRDADPIAFGRLVAAIRRQRPELVHTHLIHADLYGLPAAALARVPVRISTKHGFNEFRSRRGLALADRAVGSLAHVHVAISGGLARYLAEVEGFDRAGFEILHYGIEPALRWAPYSGEEPRFVCVGRLIPIKGHHVLLRAFAEARRAVPALVLDVAGSGPLEEELRAEAGDGIRFLGHVQPVEPAIERALAVVVPSLGEGFGMVALEAMERGRAVVASAVGGLPELIDDGVTGLLVPPGDAEALARAVVELASDPDRARAMGEAGRARALDRFGVEAAADRLDALYGDALAR